MRSFPNSPIWIWIDKIGDKTTLPEEKIKPVIAIQWGWGTEDKPNFRNIRMLLGKDGNTQSLYMNGIVFFRFALPFYIGLQLKFSRNYRWQFGLGWKLNGRLTITARRQSTESSAAGMDGPNFGQATGWADGNT